MKELQSIESAADAPIGNAQPVSDAFTLVLGDCSIRISSNSGELISGLRRYFGHYVGEAEVPTMEVFAVEREVPELGVEFTDWAREPGKAGRKDAWYDLPEGRLVRKVRTGMVFLQSESRRIAAGPCVANDNQVINFINAQYMNWLQHRDWHICHASGLVRNERALGMAGFSGGGKSTLMLQLMERDDINFMTNDRLFVRQTGQGVAATGIPKLPRVNPGTIVNNTRLHPLISAERRAELLQLPKEELWHLEEKYDAIIDDLYGSGRITDNAPLAAFLVLHWQRDSGEPVQLRQVDLTQRRELLQAIMKSPGPFYQYPDGRFFRDDTPLDEEAYLAALKGVPIFEATGGVDFDGLSRLVLEEILSV
jgi:HprK-related kinase B